MKKEALRFSLMPQILIVIFLLVLPNLIFAQSNNFNRLMRYDIKGISINGNLICPINGFTHGILDYGIYKQRGYYFALRHDNALLGNNMLLFETVSFENFDNENGKGMDCELVQIGFNKEETIKARFWEADDIIYFAVMEKFEGEEAALVYIMIPQVD
ncbi:MAG: hypothetical protein K2G47_08570 [Muribaculum sp.]|nr:hypothetical protein [Muribaculum sp.]